MAQCPECGAVVTEDDLFCGECGAVMVISGTAQPARQTAPTPPPQPAASPGSAPSPPSRPVAPAQDSRAQAAFILGIISLALAAVSCIPLVSLISCVGPFTGIAAIVLGVMVRRDIDARGGSPEDRKKAQQGLTMGTVGVILYLIILVAGLVLGLGLGILNEM